MQLKRLPHMKYILFAIAFLSLSVCKAQNNDTPKEPNKKAINYYYNERKRITIPPYGYDKIQKLIDNIKPSQEEDADGGSYPLDEDVYNNLSLREKFTYNMIHAETYMQNCDVPTIEEDGDKKIYAYPPDPFDEAYWSERQVNFFKDNRDSVIALMKESIERSNKIGCNYKQAIIEINAVELIPLLCQKVRLIKTDHDILVVLNLLMKAGNYKPFMESATYKKLYGDESASYKSFIYLNKENEDLIIKRAMDFYNESHQ